MCFSGFPERWMPLPTIQFSHLWQNWVCQAKTKCAWGCAKVHGGESWLIPICFLSTNTGKVWKIATCQESIFCFIIVQWLDFQSLIFCDSRVRNKCCCCGCCERKRERDVILNCITKLLSCMDPITLLTAFIFHRMLCFFNQTVPNSVLGFCWFYFI